MMILLILLKAFGLLTGVAGAHFTAERSERFRWYGFAAWFLGDVALVIVWILTWDPFMIALFGFYTYTTIKGLRNNSPGRPCREAVPDAV